MPSPLLLILLILPVLALPGCSTGTETVGKCSVSRLALGESYCAPLEPPPSPPQFCTRSLGTVDCWSNPEALNGPPARGVADGPRTLTPAQEIDRTGR